MPFGTGWLFAYRRAARVAVCRCSFGLGFGGFGLRFGRRLRASGWGSAGGSGLRAGVRQAAPGFGLGFGGGFGLGSARLRPRFGGVR
nr:hypothetical protein GCM10020063_102090 [Dactylosporangium thailandense]